MSVKRQLNLVGSMRVDVPHLRMLESAVANDFQVLSGTLMAGSKALVGWGATILDTIGVGHPASALTIRMAGAVLLHATASEAGTVFTVPTTQPDDVLAGTNPNVVGAFANGQTNYVGIDLVRAVDDSTADVVVFRSNTTKAEFTQTIPLGRVLNYRIHISTTDFGLTPNICPVAKVVVGSSGDVTSVTDCRQMFWRLGTGGSTPNKTAQYPWANRDEALMASAFSGGDKDIASQADFNRAIMQRLWELGGGEHWYSPADDRSVQLVYDPGAALPASNENWYWNSGTSTIQWAGLSFLLANSTALVNEVQDGSFILADGDVVYVDLDRTTDRKVSLTNPIVPVHSTRAALFGLIPPNPGSRFVLAWRNGAHVFVGGVSVEVNHGGAHATNTTFGTVKLFTSFQPDPANPIVPVMDAVYSLTATDPANVVARGITRDLPGILHLGAGANDTSVTISKVGAIASVAGSLNVANGLTVLLATGGVAVNVDATGSASANAEGISSTGKGVGAGIYGHGGSSGGTGVIAHGGTTGGMGLYAGCFGGTSPAVWADGNLGGGPGLKATGGNNGTGHEGINATGIGVGAGVIAYGGVTNGNGVEGHGGGGLGGAGLVGWGSGGLPGVQGTGGPSGSTSGVTGTGGGGGSDYGVYGSGGAADGFGVFGVGGTTGGTGVSGQGGAGGGTGVSGVGIGSGYAGVVGTGSPSGPGGQFVQNDSTNPNRGNINLSPSVNPPAAPADGDLWCDAGHFRGRVHGHPACVDTHIYATANTDSTGIADTKTFASESFPTPLAVAPNSAYTWTAHLRVHCTASGTIHLVPTTASSSNSIMVTAPAGITNADGGGASIDVVVNTIGFGASGGIQHITVTGMVVNDSGSPDTFALRWYYGSGGSPTTVYHGSVLRWTRIY